MTNSGADERLIELRSFVKSLPRQPGVYRMIDASGKVIYVGKAANLYNRVSSYFKAGDASVKTRAMVSHIQRIEVTVTRSANEALILENNLIKSLHPRYNVLLRDDKTYPEIELSSGHDFPRLKVHRGKRIQGNRYFGPYPDAGRIRDTLEVIQKLFLLRNCDDSFFRNRTRPCLQYQIKRCKAPCVGLVSREDYVRDVNTAVLFLEGKNDAIIDHLTAAMDAAAQQLKYEQAARLRDQIGALRRLQERQFITSNLSADVDVVACALKGDAACIDVFQIRGGRNLGNRSFFPKCPPDLEQAEVLSAFLARHYLGREAPPEILAHLGREEADLLAAAMRELSGRRVRIIIGPRGERLQWLKMARVNAEQNLSRHLGSRALMSDRYAALRSVLGLAEVPERMECFDISHTSGEATVASCVVFDDSGPAKSEYRRFNIDGIQPGDDYAAMRQALTRRFRHLVQGEGKSPDLLFIDGGKGQCNEALAVFQALSVEGVIIVGVAKGPERIPGQEWLYLPQSNETLRLASDSPALHLIQQIRDEAHRFAIAGHRARRGKARTASRLEQIPGIGPGRRRQLLRHFGGIQGVSRAQTEEIQAIPGISRELAERIHDAFHGDGA